MPNDSLFFESEHDVFGRSGTILNIDDDSTLIIPRTAKITDTTYNISYDISDEDKLAHPTAIAKVNYSYNGVPIGEAFICYMGLSGQQSVSEVPQSRTIYINIKILIAFAAIFVVIVSIIGSIVTRIRANNKYSSRNDRIRFNRRKKEFNRSKLRTKRR